MIQKQHNVFGGVDLIDTYKTEPVIKTVAHLKKGNSFKLTTYKKFRIAEQVIPLTKASTPEKHKGKILVVTNDSRQLILDPNTKIIIQPTNN